MTENCKIAARLENNRIISSTVELPNFFSLCFDEKDFISIMEEVSAIEETKFNINTHIPEEIVPEGIGIIFYDYKNKALFSCQDYSVISKFSVIRMTNTNIFSEYKKNKNLDLFKEINKYILGQDNEICANHIIEKINKEIKKGYKLNINNNKSISENLLNYFFNYNIIAERHLYQTFNNIKNEKGFRNRFTNEIINFNGDNIFEDFYSLYEESKDMFGNPSKELKEDFYYLNIEYQGWKIYDCMDIYKTPHILKDYLKKENLINNEDIKKWNTYLLK